MSETNNIDPTSKVSRRNFLKLLGIGAGTIVATKFERFLNENERKQIFQNLISEKDTPQGQETLTAWLKFNGAEIYAKTMGYTVSEKVVSHFLYGGGRN